MPKDVEMTATGDATVPEISDDSRLVETEPEGCWDRMVREDHGKTLYLNNTCENWGRILACVFTLYTFCGLLFWALLEASIAYGKPVLYTFFVLFLFFLIVVVSAVVVGHVDRLKAEREAREAAVGMED